MPLYGFVVVVVVGGRGFAAEMIQQIEIFLVENANYVSDNK